MYLERNRCKSNILFHPSLTYLGYTSLKLSLKTITLAISYVEDQLMIMMQLKVGLNYLESLNLY